MTRKHFQQMANILLSHRENMNPNDFQTLVNDFAIFCKSNNAAFNFDRFRDAAGAS